MNDRLGIPEGVSVTFGPIRGVNKCPVTGALEVVEYRIDFTSCGYGVEVGALRKWLQSPAELHIEVLAYVIACAVRDIVQVPVTCSVDLVEGLTMPLTPWRATFTAR